MSNYYTQPDPRIDYAREDDGQRSPEGYLRYEAARAAELFARDAASARSLERVLLTAAELPVEPERNDDQPDLFAA